MISSVFAGLGVFTLLAWWVLILPWRRIPRVIAWIDKSQIPLRALRWSLGIAVLTLMVLAGATSPAPQMAEPPVSQGKTEPAITEPAQAGDATETLRAATLFCLGFKPLLQPGETVEEAESIISPQPCGLPNGEKGFCANGFRVGPSNNIAGKFSIPWQRANADILAGLKRFDAKSGIAEACASLENQDVADMAPVLAVNQRILDARLALCIATANELDTVRRGESHKDAIILANQFSVGEKAGGQAIGHEWFAYKDGEWHESDCRSLSTAPWALGEGYDGDPIDLPDGAIAEVVNSGGWVPPQ